MESYKKKIQFDLDNGKFNQICYNETTFKDYVFLLIDKIEKQAQSEIMEAIDNLIAEEMIICHEEHQPTSRLTSLVNKIKNLNKKK